MIFSGFSVFFLKNNQYSFIPLILIAGFNVAFRNAVFGGLILACIQLVEVGLIKWNMRKEMQMYQKRQEEEIERQKEMIREMRPGTKKKI